MKIKITSEKLIHRTIILLISIFVLVCCSTLFVSIPVAYAEEISESDNDRVFKETISSLLEDGNTVMQNVYAYKKMIYDININPLGYLYEFDTSKSSGYAIIINDGKNYRPTEFFEEASSPFLAIDGKPIYISEFVYANYKQDKNVFIMGSGITMTGQVIKETYPEYYCSDGNLLLESNSQVNYAFKNTHEFTMATDIPIYIHIMNYDCAPIAGANILTYYDREKTNLIPDYSPVITLGNIYKYKKQNDKVNQVVSNLYSKMNTGNGNAGTSIADFKRGLQKYCTTVNYQISFTSCMNTGNLDYTYAKNKIDDGQPIAMFFSSLTLSRINEDEPNVDTYTNLSGTINHVMVGFGYREITYSYNNGTSQKYNFIKVATGISKMPKGYLNVDNAIFDDVYSVNII